MAHPGNATLQRGSDSGEARLEPGAPDVRASESASLSFPENPFSPAAAPAWHSRGYLSHVDVATAIQHVTFHLADSLPAEVRLRIETELRAVPEAQRNVERVRRIEDWIDAGHGCCVLRQDAAAAIVLDALRHFDAIRYRLYAWAVMPNHVHVLFQTLNGWSVAKVVTSWKSFTGRRLSPLMPSGMDGERARLEPGAPTDRNATLQRGSDVSERHPVWHREYWDRFIRNRRHFEAVREYIHENPVKANLVHMPEAYRWSSAYGEARLEPGAPTGNATLQRGSTE